MSSIANTTYNCIHPPADELDRPTSPPDHVASFAAPSPGQPSLRGAPSRVSRDRSHLPSPSPRIGDAPASTPAASKLSPETVSKDAEIESLRTQNKTLMARNSALRDLIGKVTTENSNMLSQIVTLHAHLVARTEAKPRVAPRTDPAQAMFDAYIDFTACEDQ